MIWWILLGILLGLAVLPLGISASYDDRGAAVKIIAGPVKIPVFPGKKKEKPKKEEPPEEPQKAEPAKPKPAPEQGGSWRDFLPLVQVALDFLGEFRRKLRVNCLKLHLTMAADDPCDLAVNYGRANAAMAGLLTQLERLFVIKKRDIHINCDFTASQSVILAQLDLTITLGRLVSLAVRYGIRALKTFLNIKKQQEGGANL